MTRGLLWLPLLVAFIGLAWAGWHEFQKVDAYQRWAKPFQRAKYDIYAVLGQNDHELTWGKPTRHGPIDLQTFSLTAVESIQLIVGDRPVDLDHPPEQGRQVALEFRFANATSSQIPFTDVALAARWGQHLHREWQRFRSETTENV